MHLAKVYIAEIDFKFGVSMSLTPYTDTNSRTLIISVQNNGSVAQVTKDLNDALTLVQESLSDSDLYFATIDISGTWRPGDPELNPWEETYVSAWTELLKITDLREPIAA